MTLVIDIFLPKGGKILAIQAERRLAPGANDVALVEFQPHRAGHRALRGIDEGIQRLAQGREPQTVVGQFGIFDRNHLLEVHRLAVEDERFEFAVRVEQNRAAGGLIHAARLHPHQPIFDQIHAPDAVRPADGVQPLDEFGRAQAFSIDGNRRAALELDFDILRLIRRVFGRGGNLVHALFRLVPGVFQQAALVRKMPQVRIAAVNGFDGSRDWHVVFGGVGNGILARANLPFAPGGDDFQARVECHHGQFEAHLVVPLAGRAVRHRVRADLVSHIHQMLGNQRAGNRCPQQIFMLIHRTRFEHREQVLSSELLAHIVHDELAGAAVERFLLQFAHIFIALADVGAEANHFAAVVFLQPGDDHGRVQPTGVGEDHFLDGRFWFGHRFSFCLSLTLPSPIGRGLG